MQKRMKKRKITEDEVINAIKFPDKNSKKKGNIMFKKIFKEPR